MCDWWKFVALDGELGSYDGIKLTSLARKYAHPLPGSRSDLTAHLVSA
jgi:hypothetical protein